MVIVAAADREKSETVSRSLVCWRCRAEDEQKVNSQSDADLFMAGLDEQVGRPLLLWVDGDGKMCHL